MACTGGDGGGSTGGTGGDNEFTLTVGAAHDINLEFWFEVKVKASDTVSTLEAKIKEHIGQRTLSQVTYVTTGEVPIGLALEDKEKTLDQYGIGPGKIVTASLDEDDGDDDEA